MAQQIIEVHNDIGSTMEEMDLIAFLLGACVNWTRDGQNRENDPVRKNGKKWSKC